MIEESRAQLVKLVPKGIKIKTEVEVIYGRVVDELISEINNFQADLVVICSHGTKGSKHLLSCSVVEKLARLPPGPVLTVRASSLH